VRHTHYKPDGAELTNWEWCGTAMSLDSENTVHLAHVTCGRCLKKMGTKGKPKKKPRAAPVSGFLKLTFNEDGRVIRGQVTGTAARKFYEALLRRDKR
jgi:hypothetical protein